MKHTHVGSSLRGHRKSAGLEQKELAWILGLPNEEQASRHERATMVPTLSVAFGYEVIFGASPRELFPRLYEDVRLRTEERLVKLEYDLHQLTIKGRAASIVARKLEFLGERKSPTRLDPRH